MNTLENELLQIEEMIYVIRGQRVMLDTDLAKLYGVEDKALRFQIGTSKSGKGGRRYLPYVFTENGVAMLSSVLSSDRAVDMNIAIMRIFTKLRSFHALGSNLAIEVKELKNNTNHLFKIVFELLDSIEDDLTPKLPNNRKKIGIKTEP